MCVGSLHNKLQNCCYFSMLKHVIITNSNISKIIGWHNEWTTTTKKNSKAQLVVLGSTQLVHHWAFKKWSTWVDFLAHKSNAQPMDYCWLRFHRNWCMLPLKAIWWLLKCAISAGFWQKVHYTVPLCKCLAARQWIHLRDNCSWFHYWSHNSVSICVAFIHTLQLNCIWSLFVADHSCVNKSKNAFSAKKEHFMKSRCTGYSFAITRPTASKITQSHRCLYSHEKKSSNKKHNSRKS